MLADLKTLFEKVTRRSEREKHGVNNKLKSDLFLTYMDLDISLLLFRNKKGP